MNTERIADDVPWVAASDGYGLHDPHGNVLGLVAEPELAQRIVKCVNAHDLLMAALLEIKATAEYRVRHGRYPGAIDSNGHGFEAWTGSLVDATLDAIVALYDPQPDPLRPAREGEVQSCPSFCSI